MRKGLERSTEITKGSGSCGRSKGLLHWLEFLKNLKGSPEFCHGLVATFWGAPAMDVQTAILDLQPR